jgi:hypothetical protein
MNNLVKVIICGAVLTLFGGCAYGHYLGLHGPTIKATPEFHEDVVEDQACLSCHHPDENPTATPTSHPQFVGCLKCHNDSLKK